MDNQYEVMVTPFAEQSMREITKYIAHELMAPEAAVNLLKKLWEEIRKLAFMPQRVHLTPEEPWRGMGIRRSRVKNYYIYFWINEEKNTVMVIDAIYVARDQVDALGNISWNDSL